MRKKYFLAFCFLACFLSAPAPAHALLDKLLGKKEAAPIHIKKYPIQDEDSFIAGTKSFHEIPFNNPRLEFDVLLPKNWISEPLLTGASTDLSPKILTEIAHFESPLIGIHHAVFTVHALRLEREMTAEQWLKHHLSSNGFTISGPVRSSGDKLAAAHFTYVQDTLVMDASIRAEINGNAIIVARFDAPLPLREDLSFLQQRTVQSFRLILTTNDPVEPQTPYTLSNALKLAYPASWTLQNANLKDNQRMSFDLHRLSSADNLLGLVRFAVIRRANYTTLTRELDLLAGFFDKNMDIRFTNLLTSAAIPGISSRFLFSRLEAYEAESKLTASKKQEVHLAILGDSDWYVIAYLMTPPEKNTPITWAENTQAFKIILQSIR